MNQLKKIIYFLDFPFSVGGSNKVLLTQAFIMKQKGYQVKVVIPNDTNGKHALGFDQLCEEYGIDTLTAYYTVCTCMEAINIPASLESYPIIENILKVYQPDLIHSAQINIAVELAARAQNIPHLMNIYQVEKESFNVNWMKIYPQYHSSDSLFTSVRWEKGLGIPSKCIRVAYKNKVQFQKYVNEEKLDLQILTIGVFCERKNQLEIIKFVLKCRKNGYRIKLTLVGECNNQYGLKCKKFVAEHKLQETVIFVGFTLGIEEYLKRADLFILASTVESYPGVIVESMANHVPIISTPVAGVPEVLEDEINGFLTEGYTSEDIYNAFKKFLECKASDKISLIVENAYMSYLKNHTYAVTGSKLEEYYHWIMDDYSKCAISMTAEQVRQRIDEFADRYRLDIKDQELRELIWLLYHIFSATNHKDNHKIAIWGAGFWGGKVFEWIRKMQEEAEFIGFIDTNKVGKYLGYPIVQDKEALILQCGITIVAIQDEYAVVEVMSYMDKLKKVRNKDYFLINNTPRRI